MHDVNVNGTSTVAALCAEYGARMVYVSSVHAIPENGALRVLTETDAFSPEAVQGWYAKSKAEATRNVLAAVRERGLDAVVVHPSGIIGPYTEDNHLVQLIGEYIDGSLPACVRGGYDFVDVRDVAAGCIAAADKGRRGECYILSNRHYEVRELLELARRCCGGPPYPSYGCMRAACIAVRCTPPIPSIRCRATTAFRTTRPRRSWAFSRATSPAPWRTPSSGCAADARGRNAVRTAAA